MVYSDVQSLGVARCVIYRSAARECVSADLQVPLSSQVTWQQDAPHSSEHMALTGQRNIDPPDMQHQRHHHTLRQQSLAWLLWVALLLPVAQTAALWHGVSHAASAWATSQPTDDQAPHIAHCDLCLSAAALGFGAMASAPLALQLAALRHRLPQTVPTQVWLAAARLAYQSRAPPFSPA